jgi:hypothetical protein
LLGWFHLGLGLMRPWGHIGVMILVPLDYFLILEPFRSFLTVDSPNRAINFGRYLVLHNVSSILAGLMGAEVLRFFAARSEAAND